MSDTEDEPFDKEAEKEKLRDQLAAEEASRQETQHMSELLLKGATMTNRHCDECGDPLFRHEGREFCPTCGRQRAAAGAAADTADVAGQPAQEAGQPADEVTQASGEGGTAAAAEEGAQPTTETTQPSTDAGISPQQGPAGGQPPQGTTRGQSQTDSPQPAGAADLPAAREALARKVTALAQEAEATTDVGRAQELLAAVREGAEALRALEGQR